MKKTILSVMFSAALLIGAGIGTARAVPTLLNPNYEIALLASGLGAVTGLAFSPTGDLLFTDFSGGRLLRANAPFQPGPASIDVVTTGIAFPTDLAFTANGRLFVASSTSGNPLPLYH